MAVDTAEDQRGIDRRTLIRRAAVVGAAAWTAPVIIGSLTSPAAATTGTCTTPCVIQSGSPCTWYGFRIQDPSTTCTPMGGNPSRCSNVQTAVSALAAAGTTLNATCPPGTIVSQANDDRYVFTLPGGCNVYAAGVWNNCVAGHTTQSGCTFTSNQPTQDISHADYIVCCCP